MSSQSRHSCERGNRENIQHAQVRVPRAQHVGCGRGLQEKKLRSDAKRLCLPPPFIKFLTFLLRVLRQTSHFPKPTEGLFGALRICHEYSVRRTQIGIQIDLTTKSLCPQLLQKGDSVKNSQRGERNQSCVFALIPSKHPAGTCANH